MFLHRTRLPHILPPEFYRSQESHDREMERLHAPAWHLIGSTNELSRPGDFVTRDLLGMPLLIRNCDGELCTFLNACAHRHCAITSQPCGRSERLKCQYHGWEFDAGGYTRKIPEPKSFPPFDKEVDRLKKFRTATCGQLVFVSLASEGPTLAEHLGAGYELVQRQTDPQNWRLVWQEERTFAANWKVPLENSLEAYHVELVHPQTFVLSVPAEKQTHRLEGRWTMLEMDWPTPTAVQRGFHQFKDFVFRCMGRTPSARYEHHHFFPTFLYSFSQVTGFAFSAVPETPTSCRVTLRGFSVASKGTGLYRPVVALIQAIATDFMKRLVREDLRMFEVIQRGLNVSQAPGVLGNMEERLFAFHQHIYDECWRDSPYADLLKTLPEREAGSATADGKRNDWTAARDGSAASPGGIG